ncbi:ABC transporter ATP-binding protein [Natrialba asiatica]|uniref:ABC-type D-xylose/L-arabinose transporter n=1 Tax=Natrialba asiatica (strain ATCC 700177 / DSM 12278 / JCM 9576 / FERM P-10747 / NBRC 102637 / 172P1) TaxID=29540 RepID=M0B8L0_NATA1|nr:ABC transporter ATP-binding protein [Natrialba asiatica]ELZ05979.1 glycerol-3-phosphate-transporting ATPase [Natrialba asiatica DSM 12278]
MGSVNLESVNKRYGDITAVDDIKIDVADGEFLSLVGPSGCGKSTTLEMISGLTTQSDGQIYIDDEDVTALPPKDRNIAMVFQNIALFPHMDVFDNMSYGLRIRGADDDIIDRRVDEAVEILRLDGMLDRMPSELSGGQRQRVAIGRAIVRDPEVFLMDEPLANLDAKLRVHMRTELQRIQRKLDVTAIYVTHDQEEAMTMSDRIAILNDGELQQIDPPLTCYEEPANVFVAGFIGSPSMNFIEGSIDDYRFESPITTIDAVELDEPSAVTLGIRPEDIYPADDPRADRTVGSVRASVDVIEPVGERMFVYLLPDAPGGQSTDGAVALDGDHLLMSVDPDTDIAENEELDVTFDQSSIHLFETATGNALIHGLKREPTPRS